MPKLKDALKRQLQSVEKKPYKPPEPKKPKTIVRSCLKELLPIDKTLLVGEGNFSFTLFLARHLQRADFILATAFDSLEIIEQKYPDAKAMIEEIQDWDGTVLFDIDCTKLKSYKSITRHKFDHSKTEFDTIIFMFPHVGQGIKDQQKNVLENQKLIQEFLREAKGLLSERGRVVITIKQGVPYDLWDIKSIAKQQGYKTKTSLPFLPSEFPGYTHRRTIGYKEGVSDNANQEIQNSRMFIFTL